jgi:amidase
LYNLNKTVLDSGAKLVGKTIVDELAYCLTGVNVWYGTPINPKNVELIPGGSSSGAAVAVAANLCDFGIGTGNFK